MAKLTPLLQHLLSVYQQVACDTMTSFVSDEVRAMTDSYTGVAAQLKGSNCQMIAVCHWLALACDKAGNGVRYFRQVKGGIVTLWKYFYNSPI